MIAELIRTMYEYNAWANRRVLDSAAELSLEQYRADGGASFGFVHDTLVHIMGAQWIFLTRWNGSSASALPHRQAYPDLAAMRRRWGEVERGTHEFVATRSETDLAHVVEYLNTEGER